MALLNPAIVPFRIASMALATLACLCVVTNTEAATPLVTIAGPSVIVDRCSLYTSDYSEFYSVTSNLNPTATFGMQYCTTINFPVQPITVSRGNWDIQIPITYLGDFEKSGSVPASYPFGQTHTRIDVTVTATDIGTNTLQTTTLPSNLSGNQDCAFSAMVADLQPGVDPISVSGSATLYDADAPDAPSGAQVSGQQDLGNGAAGMIHLNVPIDWARSLLTFSITVTQSLPNSDSPENTVDEFVTCQTEVCGNPTSWTDQATFNSANAPNQPSLINCQGTNCACQTAQPISVSVVPAELIQLGFTPITIIYSGIGDKSSSAYTTTLQSGTNIQFGQTTQTVNSATTDDKEALSGNLAIIFGVKDTQTWDNQIEEDEGSSYGSIVGVTSTVENDQVATNQAPAAGGSLKDAAYATQPFWNDLFVVAPNVQAAIWDYPAGPILEPLGSEPSIQVHTSDLYTCSTSSKPTVISAPALSSTATTPISYSFTASDCDALLQLDPFWVADSQSAALPTARVIAEGHYAANVNNTWTEKSSTTDQVQTTSQSSYTTKVTSMVSNSIDDGFSADVLKLFSIGSTSSVTTGSTQVTTITGQYNSMSAQTLLNSTSTQTALFDTLFSGSVNARVYQDAQFGTLAIQDQDMHFATCRLTPVACPVAIKLPTFNPTAKRPLNLIPAPIAIFGRHISRPAAVPAATTIQFDKLTTILPYFVATGLPAQRASELKTVASQTPKLVKPPIVLSPPPARNGVATPAVNPSTPATPK